MLFFSFCGFIYAAIGYGLATAINVDRSELNKYSFLDMTIVASIWPLLIMLYFLVRTTLFIADLGKG